MVDQFYCEVSNWHFFIGLLLIGFPTFFVTSSSQSYLRKGANSKLG